MIIATSSIHHLSTTQKREIIKQIRNLLKPGGNFLMYDTMCKKHESRDDHVKRLINNCPN